MKTTIIFISTIVYIFYYSLNVTAQPSGGPYGPVTQNYVLPDVKGKIYYVSPDGTTKNDGLSVNEPTTVEWAFHKASTGDAIIVRGGTYRTGGILFNQGITIQPWQDEEPVFKGTKIADKWEKAGENHWVTTWNTLFPSKPAEWWVRERNEMYTPMHRFNNDMVFIDGEFLQSGGNIDEVDQHTFYIDYENKKIYIGVDPKDKLIEITAFEFGFRRITGLCNGKKTDRTGPVIKGITFTQYAYCALETEGKNPDCISAESEHGKDVTGTILENCEISYCSRVAAYLRGDNLQIKNCRISNTSTEGIFILSSSDVLLEKNIFTQNNIEHITGYFPAAVKIFNQCYRVTCRDNIVKDHPFSNGIWYDVGNVDGVFVNNWIENVGNNKPDIVLDKLWPSDNGFFFEISKGAICAGNVFVNCDHGVMALNSCNVKFYNNTFINSMFCIGRNERGDSTDHFGWHVTSGPPVDKREGYIVLNNLFTGDENFDRPLVFIWESKKVCDRFTQPQVTVMNNNVYVRKKVQCSYELILWSPYQNEGCLKGFDSNETLNKEFPAFSKNGVTYTGYNGPVFTDPDKNDLNLSAEFPGINAATDIPEEIVKYLNNKDKNAYIGAYQGQ